MSRRKCSSINAQPSWWVDTADPLHFGNFGGLVSKTIWFLFGLVLSTLALTGAYLHVCRQRRHRDPPVRRLPVQVAYIATVVVLIIATTGAVREYSWYAPIPPPLGTWLFVSAWIVSTLAVLTVWMRKLR